MIDIFLGMLNQSLAASWLVLAVLAARFLLKKAPKWVPVLLWGLVAIRLICPFSIESPASLLPDSAPITETAVTERFLPSAEHETAANQTKNTYNQAAVHPVRQSHSVLDVCSAVWLAGIAGILLYAGVGYGRLRRRIATAILLRDNIYQSECVTSPFVLGFLRPRIYLPFALSEQDAFYVLSHEQAHIKRGDHWWKLLGFLLLAVHWMNPLMWLTYHLLCQDIEFACDECVIRGLDREQRAGYSQALLSCSVHRSALVVCPLAFGEVGVKERVRNVLRYQKPAFWVVVAAVCACVVVAVCFMTNPKASNSIRAPFGEKYQVKAVVYDVPYYNFAYTPETAPRYALTADQILQTSESQGDTVWVDVGKCSEITLFKENFDDYFEMDEGWNGSSASKLRAENKQAWKVVVDDSLSNRIFYDILLQKNGDIYLTYGYYDRSQLSSVFFETPSICQMFQLVKEGTPIAHKENAQDALHVETVDSEAALDAAITSAVLAHHADYESDELIAVESHIILEQTEVPAAQGQEKDKSGVTVYIVVLNLRYHADGDTLTETGGASWSCRADF